MILFYLIVCGAAWYAGGPTLAGLAFLGISLWWAVTTISNRRMQSETSAADRARHASDGDGHMYYVKNDQMTHECDGCADCMAERAAQLTRQGYDVEHVPGRRTSGQL